MVTPLSKKSKSNNFNSSFSESYNDDYLQSFQEQENDMHSTVTRHSSFKYPSSFPFISNKTTTVDTETLSIFAEKLLSPLTELMSSQQPKADEKEKELLYSTVSELKNFRKEELERNERLEKERLERSERLEREKMEKEERKKQLDRETRKLELEKMENLKRLELKTQERIRLEEMATKNSGINKEWTQRLKVQDDTQTVRMYSIYTIWFVVGAICLLLYTTLPQMKEVLIAMMK
jgi:hypothetical protein